MVTSSTLRPLTSAAVVASPIRNEWVVNPAPNTVRKTRLGWFGVRGEPPSKRGKADRPRAAGHGRRSRPRGFVQVKVVPGGGRGPPAGGGGGGGVNSVRAAIAPLVTDAWYA